METWIICVSFLWFVQQSSPIGQRSRSGLHDNSYYCLSCVVDWNIFVHHSETVAQLLPTLATFDIWFIRRFLLMHISNRNLLILIEEVPTVEEKSNFEDFYSAYYNIYLIMMWFDFIFRMVMSLDSVWSWADCWRWPLFVCWAQLLRPQWIEFSIIATNIRAKFVLLFVISERTNLSINEIVLLAFVVAAAVSILFDALALHSATSEDESGRISTVEYGNLHGRKLSDAEHTRRWCRRFYKFSNCFLQTIKSAYSLAMLLNSMVAWID